MYSHARPVPHRPPTYLGGGRHIGCIACGGIPGPGAIGITGTGIAMPMGTACTGEAIMPTGGPDGVDARLPGRASGGCCEWGVVVGCCWGATVLSAPCPLAAAAPRAGRKGMGPGKAAAPPAPLTPTPPATPPASHIWFMGSATGIRTYAPVM